MKQRKILSITDSSAEIEIPSLNSRVLSLPTDVFERFIKKKVKIKIEVVK